MFEIIPTGAALGAEVMGVDLTTHMDDSTFDQIRQAFYQYEVILFRDRKLSDEDQICFSARFGQLRKLKVRRGQHLEHPEIHIVSNILEGGEYIGSYDAGMFWHTDGAYFEHPHSASLLHAIEIPQRNQRALGDTTFASMTAAYDGLSSVMKKRIAGLSAVHSMMLRHKKATESAGKKDGATGELKEAVHPVYGFTRSQDADVYTLPKATRREFSGFLGMKVKSSSLN